MQIYVIIRKGLPASAYQSLIAACADVQMSYARALKLFKASNYVTGKRGSSISRVELTKIKGRGRSF